MWWVAGAVLVLALWRVIRALRQFGEACEQVDQARQVMDEL